MPNIDIRSTSKLNEHAGANSTVLQQKLAELGDTVNPTDQDILNMQVDLHELSVITGLTSSVNKKVADVLEGIIQKM